MKNILDVYQKRSSYFNCYRGEFDFCLDIRKIHKIQSIFKPDFDNFKPLNLENQILCYKERDMFFEEALVFLFFFKFKKIKIF